MAKTKRIASKSHYAVDEVADILGVEPPTVRRWLKDNYMQGKKHPYGRGLRKRWLITRNELMRIRNELTLPE